MRERSKAKCNDPNDEAEAAKEEKRGLQSMLLSLLMSRRVWIMQLCEYSSSREV